MLSNKLFERFAINRRFARLWLAVGTSNLADGMNIAAAPLLAASLTRDPALVAGLSVAQRLPWFLFSVLTGALADRIDRRRALTIANLIRAASLGLLGLTVILGWTSLWLLYALFFFIGIAETLFDNASFAILPSMVERDDLEKANGRLFATETVANEFLGPPVGGFLFAVLVIVPFLLGSGLYAASIVLLLMMRGQYQSETVASEETSSLSRDIFEGFGWFWRHKLLRTLSLYAGAGNLVSGATFAILVLFAQEKLGLGEVGYGLLLAAGSLGGIIGGVGAGWLAARIKPGTVILLTTLLEAGSFLTIGLTSSSVVVGFLLAFISFVTIVNNIVIVSFRQAVIPDKLLGRVTSAYRMVAITGSPLGALFGGLVAKRFGLGSPFVLGGILLAVVAFLILPVVNNQRIKEARETAKL